jgi:hypothetical protein
MNVVKHINKSICFLKIIIQVSKENVFPVSEKYFEQWNCTEYRFGDVMEMK